MAAFRERDFFKRMIEQLALAFERVAKLRRERKFDEALQTLDGARQDLVTVPRALLERLDTANAASLIGDTARIRVWAKLLREEAAVQREMGVDDTDRLRSAIETMLEATARSTATDEDRAFLTEASRLMPPESLSPEYSTRLNVLIGSLTTRPPS